MYIFPGVRISHNCISTLACVRNNVLSVWALPNSIGGPALLSGPSSRIQERLVFSKTMQADTGVDSLPWGCTHWKICSERLNHSGIVAGG